MRCFAHRGFAGANPENTITAVRDAAATGADVVEVDVRRCGTGDLVVIHDDTVDRVTDGTGPVADHTLAELRALTVLESGAGVPTLDDVYEALPPDVGVNVELKERGLATDALAVASEYDNDTLVSSFEEAALREADRAGDHSLAYLVGRDTGGQIDRAQSLGCAAIHPHWLIASADFVARAHEADLTVNAWTVTSREVAAELARAGVDGLIADAPAYCRD